MKKLSLLNKIILFINYIFVLLLVCTFFISKLPAEKFTFFTLLSLTVPFIIIINFLLVLYWLIKKKKFFFISTITLFIAYFVLSPIYKFKDSNNDDVSKGDNFTLMTFNTRNFNVNGGLKINNVDSLIVDFITKKDVDILCFQEYHHAMKISDKLKQYDYKFVDFIYGKNTGRVIQAIYSKYPILKVEPIEFPKSANSAIYADVIIKKDTVRIYNLHLQSFNIEPEVSTIKNQDSKRLFTRLKKVLRLQKEQMLIIKDHYKKCTYRKILTGDFNNTQFSNTYGIVANDFQDSFIEAGEGFGLTYDLKGLPMRIDYILVDEAFEVLSHENFDVKLSDHYPLKATLRLKDFK